METCRLYECYDGQSILGGDLGDAILLGYFSNVSATDVFTSIQRRDNPLVRVDQAPPFCVGICDRIMHGWPLQRMLAYWEIHDKAFNEVYLHFHGDTYQILPTPEIRLPQGGTFFCPYPAKGQSSRNGESGSRSSEMRSRAANRVSVSWRHIRNILEAVLT